MCLNFQVILKTKKSKKQKVKLRLSKKLKLKKKILFRSVEEGEKAMMEKGEKPDEEEEEEENAVEKGGFLFLFVAKRRPM